MSNVGFAQDGSFRAWKIEKELNKDALEAHRSTFLANFPGLVQARYINSLIRFRFSFDIWPRTDISTEKWYTVNRWDRSATRGAYLPSLKSWLLLIFESQGQVSSKTMAVAFVSLIINRSGRKLVVRIWGQTTHVPKSRRLFSMKSMWLCSLPCPLQRPEVSGKKALDFFSTDQT